MKGRMDVDSKRKETEIDPDSISRASSPLSSPSIHEKGKEDFVFPPASVKSSTSISSQVPRHLRRGLLARFCLIPEITEPTLYPRRIKWMITFVVAMAAMAAPMGSAIILPALPKVSKDFGSTDTITNLSVAFYLLSMSIFPLWWSSFSETLGRRTIYIISFILFVIFGVLSAVATNVAMLIVMRMLSGGGAASVQAVGAGTIADIWEPKERGRAMGIFYLGPLCGPLFAPIIGGALAQGFGWRSTQWFLVIFGGAVSVLLIFGLPETLRKRADVLSKASEEKDAKIKVEVGVTGAAEGQRDTETTEAQNEQDRIQRANLGLQRSLIRQSVMDKTKKSVKFLKRAFLDPLRIILLLRYPAVAVTVYYAAITFGSLYFLNISIETTFSRPPYSFSTLIVGLTYLPNSLGYVLSSIFGGRWLDHVMKREARKKGRVDEKGGLIYRPEDRMKENAWLAAVLFPCAMIWYGWTAEKGVFWLVPVIANFFFGVGSMIVFAMATTMLTEFMPRRASTGIAVNNFVRNIFSCVAAVVTAPLIRAIGDGWLFTILGLLALISGFVVILAMKKYSDKWREEMNRKMKD